jgi:hypothetical protein
VMSVNRPANQSQSSLTLLTSSTIPPRRRR